MVSITIIKSPSIQHDVDDGDDIGGHALKQGFHVMDKSFSVSPVLQAHYTKTKLSK